jgi:hypothetical protein
MRNVHPSSMSVVKPAGAAALALLLGSALAAPALAQTPTLRFEPDPVAFAAGAPGTVSVFLDNASDVTGFNLVFTFDESLLSFNNQDPNRAVVDPNLAARWFGISSQSANYNSSTGLLTWFARASRHQGGAGVNGSNIRLGALKFQVANAAGTQGSFTWNGATRLDTGGSFDNLIPATMNGGFRIGVADSDLAVSCNQTSPPDPNKFVDGDTITLVCTLTNNGPGNSPGTRIAAVISTDQIVDGSDRTTINNQEVPSLPPPPDPNSTIMMTLLGRPPYSIAGPHYICTKVDVDLNNNDGPVFETDETNNTDCKPVTVLQPFRDLVPTDLAIAPGEVDPNTIRVGLRTRVTYTTRNDGNAVIRAHTNEIRFSTDGTIDAGDPLLCRFQEQDAPGILGQASVTRSFGTDQTAPASLQCGIPFTTTPGDYFFGIVADALSNVQERDPNGVSFEGNNTLVTPMAVTIHDPLPPVLRVHDTATIGATQVAIGAPGKDAVSVSIISVLDLAAYSFTLTWSNPSLMEIQDPNDVVFTTLLQRGGRAQSCTVSALSNAAGNVTLSCTTTGPGSGVTVIGAERLLAINFNTLAPGSGSLTISGASAFDSNGMPLNLTVGANNSTYTVSGPFDLDMVNPTTDLEMYPGRSFTVTYDICNNGFGTSPPGIKTEIYLSRDAVFDPSDLNQDPDYIGTDPNICTFFEQAAIPARDPCASRTVTCRVTTDEIPDNYTLFVIVRPDPEQAVPLALPPRVLALRDRGEGRAIESTGDPNAPSGSVGDLLGSDRSFKPKSIGILGSNARNLDFLAGYVTPASGGQRVALHRLPKKINGNLDPNVLTELRLPRTARTVLGGADVDGDGEDELILLHRTRDGEYLDFRSVDYTKRKPVVGLSSRVTSILPFTILGAAGVQFDGDPADEIALLTDSGGIQALRIFEPPLAPTNDPLDDLLAEDLSFGGPGDEAVSICVLDWDLDGTEEVASVHEDGSGIQALRVYTLPAGPGGETGPPLADAPGYGGTQTNKRVLAIACTR